MAELITIRPERAVSVCDVFGMGIGLDLSPYYRQCRAFDLSAFVTNAVFREIVAMITAGLRRR